MADIPINEVTRRVQFTGNTGTGPFAFTFNILVDDDLIVYKNFVLQTITTDYTISKNANGTGSITLTSALIASDVLTIIGGRALERTTDFVTAGDLLASSLNEQLDSLVIMAQQLDEKLDRSLKVDIGDQFTDLSLPAKANRVGKVMAFNATSGDPEAGPTIADTQSVADISADIATLADIQDGTVATNAITNVNTIRTDVSTVSGISGNVTTVANNDANVTTVATDLNGSDTIGTVAGSIANVNLTGPSITSVNTVAGSITNVNTTATNIADVNTVAGVSTDVSTVAGISSNVSTVSGISANVTTVAGISSNVTTVAGISGNVTTVAGQTTNLQNVTDNLTAIQNAATNATNAATSATNAATSATAAAASQTAAAASAASAASSYDSFDDRYLGVKASDPTVDNDGDPLSSGLLYFSSSENIMKVYDGASWIAATSAGNVSLTTYQYTATSGQTTFSGADDNAATLSYTVNNILVTLNGSLLFNGTDYTATTGTSVVLTSGATTSDVLQVTAFASFTTADMVPASTGGTFSGNVAITGDLTVDTNTLYVDSTNNRVGIGTSSPSQQLTLANSSSSKIQIKGHSASNGLFFGMDSATAAQIWNAENGFMRFATNDTERMRLDASGSLLVGKTTTSSGVAGIRFAGDAAGYAEFTRDGGNPLFLNRETSDGYIIRFAKDNSYVGSIGTASSRLHIENGDTGLRIAGDLDQIFPCGSGGGDRDAAIDLGSTGVRFKDLYLSGGVYLGGTGSANKLDDYELGSYDPTVEASTSGTITLNTSYDTLAYTKIGDLVTVTGLLVVSAVSSPVGRIRISLPFTSANLANGAERSCPMAVCYFNGSGTSDGNGYYATGIYLTQGGTSSVEIWAFPRNGAMDFDTADWCGGGTDLQINISYIAA